MFLFNGKTGFSTLVGTESQLLVSLRGQFVMAQSRGTHTGLRVLSKK